MKFNERGEEMPDNTPLALPAGARKPETLHEQIRRMVRGELSQVAAKGGAETFEEANDFEIDDDSGAERYFTGHEVHAMVNEAPREERRETSRPDSERRVGGAESGDDEGVDPEGSGDEGPDSGDRTEDDASRRVAPQAGLSDGGRSGQRTVSSDRRVKDAGGPVRPGAGARKKSSKVN